MHSAVGDDAAAVAANELALELGTAEQDAVRQNLERAKKRVRNAELASASGTADRLALLRTSVQESPDDLESLLRCGEVLLEVMHSRSQVAADTLQNECDELANCAKRAMELAPADALPVMLCAQLCMQSSDWDGAFTHFSSAVSLAAAAQTPVPQVEADATAGLGLACYRQDNYEEAVTLFTKAETLYRAVSCEPDRSLLLNRGSARQRLGDLAGAYEDFDSALMIDEQYAAAHLARGTVMAALQQDEAAESDYTAALACAQNTLTQLQSVVVAQPTHDAVGATDEVWLVEHNLLVKTLQARGDLHAKRGRNADAAADYSALLDLAVSAPPETVDCRRTLLARGHVLCNMGSYSAAHADFIAVLDSHGLKEGQDDEKLVRLAYTALGNLYQLQGEYMKATESFSKAV